MRANFLLQISILFARYTINLYMYTIYNFIQSREEKTGVVFFQNRIFIIKIPMDKMTFYKRQFVDKTN